MPTTEAYVALRESAAWRDVSSRGRLRAFGEDRKRLLHALATNHIDGLVPGQGVYAFFLNAQGRVLADAVIACRESDFLILTEPETREKLAAHIDCYIIADDVTLEDLTDTTCEFTLEGPGAGARLAELGLPAPEAEYGIAESDGISVVRAALTGQPGFRIIAPLDRRDSLCSRLAANAPEASAEDLLAVRLENAVPRYGDDISERYIAHETGRLDALHFNKGCYLGQEIVERVRSRGLVHRQLHAFRIEGPAVPPPGEKLLAGDKEAGEITSAAWSPAEGVVRALAYLRQEFASAPDLRTAAGQRAQLADDHRRNA